MGKQKTYSWEFKLQMVHLLEKGLHNVSQISRDYQVAMKLISINRPIIASREANIVQYLIYSTRE